MSQGRRKHSSAFKAKVAPAYAGADSGGGEGRGDGGRTGRPVRSPPRPDSGLEESPCGGRLRHLRQRQGTEGQGVAHKNRCRCQWQERQNSHLVPHQSSPTNQVHCSWSGSTRKGQPAAATEQGPRYSELSAAAAVGELGLRGLHQGCVAQQVARRQAQGFGHQQGVG